jgi:HlyD family secretion protein
VELDALEAQRQLTVAEGELITLRGQLETGVLNQQATVSRTRNEHRDAVRRLAAYREVPQEVSKLTIEQAEDRVNELKDLLEIHERSLELLEQSRTINLAAKASQVERLGQIVDFQHRRLESLQVRAGTRGVVRELPVQVGQYMGFGQSMGVIIQPGRLKAQVRLHEAQARDVVLGQPADVDTRPRVIKGHVARIDPAAVAGMVTVDVALDEELPQGVYAGQNVDAVVLIERLDDVLYLARPSLASPRQSMGLFKIVDNGNAAVRVTLRFGRSSVDRVEIEWGAEVGDEIILTDMSRYDAFDRVRIKR